MTELSLIHVIFLIFTGAAIFATAALYTRQSLLIAYILLGMLVGPWGLDWIHDTTLVSSAAEIGIIFLLFLLGLNLHPQDLVHMFKNTIFITIVSSVIFGGFAFGVSFLMGFGMQDAIIIAVISIFSSTIIGLKLLPTTILHHQRLGEIVISILLLQDIIAIITLLLVDNSHPDSSEFQMIIRVLIALPLLFLFCFLAERYVLRKLITKFDQVQEYIFLLAIGWCLGITALAEFIGLSAEIGAFIAGVSLATSSISLFISESLKPLRDFFLVMFFFALGAQFNTHALSEVWLGALILSIGLLIVKPITFAFLLKRTGEKTKSAFEIGVRLGQLSEFSLLVAYIAENTQAITQQASQLIQVATVITFIISSYVIGLKYPTPISLGSKMHRD